MNTQPNDSNVSIMELPAIISLLCERANYPLLPEAKGTVNLFVRYLRRKAERGLAVIYTVDDVPVKGQPGQSCCSQGARKESQSLSQLDTG